ncbi:POP1-domain-containing protein [Flagelloscypha sp. PMI_526]|nr:POP1-domain-containing protein [Flagelloscypha sp. PMI_526]
MSKRKANALPTHKDRKKQKIQESRTISVQPTTSSSMSGLPPTLDVERFAEARSFEINAMELAMKNAGSASTSRAWQELPRHLRRRAASHDVRRVPNRLRERAAAEMDPVKEKKKPRKPKLGKEKRRTRTEILQKRQRDKTWLETHIWHAKRMHMETKFGYRLAITPTEKSFRPSYRAAMHGSIVHDASYFEIIEMKGPKNILVSILEGCLDPQDRSPAAISYANGSRLFESHLYDHGHYPFNLLGPVSLLWRPHVEETSEKTAGTSTSSAPNSTIWIRLHPSIFSLALRALKTGATQALHAASRASNEAPTVEVEFTNLSNGLNTYEIMGPKANQVLKGALKPVSQDKRAVFAQFWDSLGDLQTSASCPSGIVVGMKVVDPRLSFPPHNAKSHYQDFPQLPAANRSTPTPELANSELWEQSVRDKLAKPKYKKKELDDRRSKGTGPGTKLNPLRLDDRVPCLLIQRSLRSAVSSSQDQGIHGWTLYVPSGWGMAFWPSLTHTGTRVGGQRERQTQSFEAGLGHFPLDYPFTASYKADTEEHAKEEREKWERTPKGKRVGYEKLGTRSPWVPDWELVLGFPESDWMTTQREEGSSDINENIRLRPWLLRGVATGEVVQHCIETVDPETMLLQQINHFRTKRHMLPLEHSVDSASIAQGALVRVRLKMTGRGSPKDMACLYAMEDSELSPKQQDTHAEDSPDDDDTDADHAALRSPESIIGYVTSGNFSLSQGQGSAIGALPFRRYIDLAKQSARLSMRSPMIGVRNRDGHTIRLARIELLHD